MLLLLFGFQQLICVFVFTVNNPIYAAFWLILTFLSSANLLWILNSSFFAVIYLIIYVGAIAVLFLFVIMMLDIKNIEFAKSFNNYFTVTVYAFWMLIPFLISFFFSTFFILENSLYFEENSLRSFDLIFDLQILGQTLYNYYIVYILIGGLILLVAVLGATILTLTFSIKPLIKLTTAQIARTALFLSFFK